MLTSTDVSDLRARMCGELLLPGDPGYVLARRVWNGMIDRRPALIARCAGRDDVVTAVNYGRDHGLPIAVRGGGHHVGGYAVCDDGLVIDLSRMKAVSVDPSGCTATAQAGLTWGELDRATQARGLAAPGGVVSTTGIAGLTLGGGLGWLRRAYGLACDNLVAAEVVTADGRVVLASAEGHPDLLWGLRGGGGNFGIVTAFTYQLHRVGPEVTSAAVLYPLDCAEQVLRAWRDYVLGATDTICSDAICLSVPAHPAFPRGTWGQAAVLVQAAHTGAPEAGERQLRPLRQLGAPLADLSGRIAYVDLQRSADWMYPAYERQYYWRSLYLQGFPDDAIARVVRLARADVGADPADRVAAWRGDGAGARRRNGLSSPRGALYAQPRCHLEGASRGRPAPGLGAERLGRDAALCDRRCVRQFRRLGPRGHRAGGLWR